MKDYDYDELFPGRFLKSGEFKGKPYTLTITNVELEEMEDRKGTKMKAILSFKETKKQIVMNRTNGECIKGMFGRKVSVWVGKKVTFYPDTVSAFGSKKLAIRVLGSPDLASDTKITVKIGRDPEFDLVMKKTGGQAKPNGKAPPKQVAAPSLPTDEHGNPVQLAEPPHDPETGEVFEPPFPSDDDAPHA